MNKVKKVKVVFLITLLLLFVNSLVKAADNQKWYEDREEAFAIAKEQKKYVFLLYGRTSCGNCNAAKKYISESPIKEIVNDNFILWFCNMDIDEKENQAGEYRGYYSGSITLPLLCVIDPENSYPALSYSKEYRTAEEIAAILTNNMPTSNDKTDLISDKVFVSNKTLTISNNNQNETILVLTSGGQLIDSFNKKDHTTNRSMLSYPMGVLIINSTSGWSTKIFNIN